MQNEGFFITFEGGEGGGKSTVLQALYDFLSSKGFNIITTREPGGVLLSEEIRLLLLEKEQLKIDKRAELLLFLAARAQHVHELILPYLKKGYIVLCDRFNDSSIAYQGIARGLGEETVRAIADFSSFSLKPNLTLLFDIDPKVGLKRTLNLGRFDRIENEQLEFHEKVRQAYLELAKKEPDRIIILDASKDKELVIEQALSTTWNYCERVLKKTF
jgi:dTMP kinase